MANKKRIIVIGMSENRGGMESYLINLFRAVRDSEYVFDFFLPHSAPKTAYEDEIVSLGGRCLRMAYGRTEGIRRHWSSIREVLSLPDVVGAYINTCLLTDIDLIFMAWWRKMPIRIIHSHNTNYMSVPSKAEKILERMNKCLVYPVSSRLLACSSVAGKWMFGKRAFSVIHNGIDIMAYGYSEEKRNEIRRKMGIACDDIVIGTVGRIQYQKNPEFIVQLFRMLSEINDRMRFFWIGGGEYDEREKVKGALEEAGLTKQVFMPGMVNNTHELYQAMDGFILPSRFEGLPFVLVEAQCAGLPCWVSEKRITEESDLTGLVHFLPLEAGTKYWAERINDFFYASFKRCGYQRELIEKGYSMADTGAAFLRICNGEDDRI